MNDISHIEVDEDGWECGSDIEETYLHWVWKPSVHSSYYLTVKEVIMIASIVLLVFCIIGLLASKGMT